MHPSKSHPRDPTRARCAELDSRAALPVCCETVGKYPREPEVTKHQAMRNGQNKQRMRGRNNPRKGQNPLTRVYESNGPDVKIRGTASHVAEKYVQLARDAQSSGDPVAAENYYQHAEHYFRLIAAVQEQFRPSQPFGRDNESRDYEDSDEDFVEPGMGGEPYNPQQQREPQAPPYAGREFSGRDSSNREFSNRESSGRDQQPFPHREPQPYPPRDAQQHQPRERYQQREQPFAPRRPPPEVTAPTGDANDVERLPAFVTGGAPQPNGPAYANGQNGQSGQNGGFEGGADRFPLHRRRRRRPHGPREPMAGGSEGGEGAGPAVNPTGD